MTVVSSIKFQKEPRSLYIPFDYILKIGGKRIRPTLALAANQLFNGHLDNALPAAASIELFHNFTLMHDDIMDVADLRRGQATVHKQFNMNTAILSGDAMLIYAYQLLEEIPNFSKIIHVFNKTAIEVCEGQQLDLDFEEKPQVSINEYLRMIELKTAVLLAASLQVGAMTANADEDMLYHIYEFGNNLGISYQIMDDVLDAFADKRSFGKKIGGDIILNKKTYLLVRAIEICDNESRRELLSWLEKEKFDEVKKVSRIKNIYTECKVVEDAKEKSREYFDKGLFHLTEIEKKGFDISELESFANKLLYRSV